MSGKNKQRQVLSFDENEFCDDMDEEQNAAAENFRSIHRSEDVPATISYIPSDPELLLSFQNNFYLNKYSDIKCKLEKKIEDNVETHNYLLTSKVVPNDSPFMNLASNLILDYFGRIPVSLFTQPNKQEPGEVGYFSISLTTKGCFAEDYIEKFTRRLIRIYIYQHKKKIFIKKNFERIEASITSKDYEPLQIEQKLISTLPLIKNAILLLDEGKCVCVLFTLKTEINHHGVALDDLTYSTKLWTTSIGSKATKVSEIINTNDPAVHRKIKEAFQMVNDQERGKYLERYEILPHTFNLTSRCKNFEIKREIILDSYKSRIEQIYCYADEKN